MSGVRLGPYEIVGPLGSGGMGEVYRARDPRLGRDVAIKVLPSAFSADPERLHRFEQEARAAAALNHPNILAVHDIGTHDGSPYIVSELLEGETLRERLNGGALPMRKTVEYAVQITHGLAAAHEKSITHRDLKPENIFITADGRVKILDFGLAKLTQAEPALAGLSALPTTPPNTLPGVVLGTIGYMSPEQVRGLSVDHRSDIFALGAVIYEMLTGRRAFQRDTVADTLSAILKEDPPESSGTERPLPLALDRIVRYCLEKNPDERFQSARDVGLALEAFSGSSTAAEKVAAPEGSTRLRLRLAIVTVAVAIGLALVSGWWLHGAVQPATDAGTVTMPTFQRLTFRRGFVWAARFAPDGETVVYSAQWEGGRPEVYITSATSPESRPLGLAAHLAGISSSGELAVLVNPRIPFNQFNLYGQLGTLAHLPLTGGAPREVADAIWYADWAPDGREQAVVCQVGRRWRLEYPIGRILQESSNLIISPRISPRGDLVAFFEGSGFGNYAVNIVDREGGKRSLSPGWVDWWFLAWAPGGQEVWFGASESGRASPLYAVDLTGRQRLILRVPGTVEMHDVSRGGRILLSQARPRYVTLGLPPGERQEQGFSWHDHSRVTDLSSDGRTLVFMETGEAGGRTGVIYLRPTDGSSAVRLGEGQWGALSPDLRWVAAVHGLNAVSLLPTRAGEPREFSLSQFEHITRATWFPDGRRLLIAAREPGRDVRLYIHPIDGGDPEPIGPAGFGISEVGRPLSPAGDLAAAIAPDGSVHLITTDKGEPRPAAGVEAGELPTGWSADGRSMYVFRRAELPTKIYRVEIATGRRTLWKELTPGDVAGVVGIQDVVVTPDGQSYFYTYHQALSELYLVDGVK